MIKKINGNKINLRQISKNDAESIYVNASDYEISQYTFIPYPYTMNHAKDFITRAKDAFNNASEFHFGIEEREQGDIIGMVGLQFIDYTHKRAELGYWLGKRYWGKGFTTESVKLMLGFAFSRLNLQRIQAFVFPENKASMQVLEKCGFNQEALLRKYQCKNNLQTDSYIYAIVRDDYF